MAGPGGEDFFVDANGDRWMDFHAWDAANVGPDAGGKRQLWVGRFSVASGRPAVTLVGNPQP